ncbi:MFS transporter [Bradyrhizobium sp. 145]|uniref:MFS transporter n=1 Tax=Bradyrhizobium sp. 145 TaxID=2782621 RepID=UPI001FFA7468|nr:MFS transporter [Bradyrhizobium sp. 145]MCK1690216.1 MFS transporter [Bradyrhizobium sp. 145]
MKAELKRRLATTWNDDKLVVAALGASEIISYGTLYYCVAAVANAVARDLAITDEWIFACFSFALFASSLISFIGGRLMDRYGAGKMMRIASVVGAASLGIAAVSWNAVVFAIALFGMQIASAFLFYEAAFVFLVQRDARHAKRQITLLTLIVGFSSTLFWPLTSFLLTLISWRQIFWIYAGSNVLVALPLISWALRTRSVGVGDQKDTHDSQACLQSSTKVTDLVLITGGFSFTAFVFSAFLGQMIPILSSIGSSLEGAMISALFGPSQVLVPLFAASIIEKVAAIRLTIVSCALLSAATLTIALASGSVLGVTAFVVLLGFSSGLNSICRGTLPLSIFGRGGYGGRVGLITGFRLSFASFAPLFFSSIQSEFGIAAALASLVVCAVTGMLAFMLVSVRSRRA